jgi:hypothetical protein
MFYFFQMTRIAQIPYIFINNALKLVDLFVLLLGFFYLFIGYCYDYKS